MRFYCTRSSVRILLISFFVSLPSHAPRPHALTARLPTGNSQTPAPIPKYRGKFWCHSVKYWDSSTSSTRQRAHPHPRHQP